ncbi:MAG: T9SS type A sorting domain-containing protein [Ferruginibacter sp.]
MILLVFLLAAPYCSISQQWIQTKGPGGGKVIDMIEKNGSILAATYGGIFRSTNNGDTWARSHTGFPDGGFPSSFATIDNVIYASSQASGVYLSSDNGITWNSVPGSNYYNLKIFASHDTLYLGSEGGGVLRSINNGPFQPVNTGLPATSNVNSFAQVGQYLFIGLRGNGGSVGIYRSLVNSSISWTQMNTGLIDFPSIIDLKTKGADLFVTAQSFNDAGLFRSTNLGANWFSVSPPSDPFFSYLTIYQGDIYGGTFGSGVYKSINDGADWTVVNSGLKPLTVWTFLPGSNGLFVGFERGLARTTNNAASWELKNRGLTNTSATSLYSAGDTLFSTTQTAGMGDSDGLFFTTDGGQNWTPMDKGLFPSPQGNAFVKSENINIIGTGNEGIFIKRPTDTAFLHPVGVPTVLIVFALFSNSQVVLAGVNGSGELYRSVDNGVTWNQSNTGFNGSQGDDQVYCFYEKAGVIFAGAFNAIYKSTDQGLTWTNSNAGIYSGTVIKGITGMGNDLYAVGGFNRRIYKSTDNGATWLGTNNGLPLIIDFNAIIAANGILYAGSDLGIYRSIDNGGNWQEFNDGLLSFTRKVLSFAIHNNQVYVGTDETAVWGQASVIPVQLINFNVTSINNTYIRTSWTVAQESDIQSYIVERAISGTNNFIEIGNIASSNSQIQKDYEFIDRGVEKNVLYQYRLKIVEAAGANYSEIRIAMISGKNITISISPNPSDGFVKVIIHGYEGPAEFAVMNTLGHNIYHKSEKVNNGSTVLIDISSQKSGVFVVKINMPAESFTKKIVIK